MNARYWWLLAAASTVSCSSILDIPSDVVTDDSLGNSDAGSKADAGLGADTGSDVSSDSAESSAPDSADEGGPTDARLDAADVSETDGDEGGHAEAGCTADLQTDPHNCGRCDHDCLGGDCEAGECKSYQLRGPNGYVSDLVVFDGFIYYSIGCRSQIAGEGPGRSLGKVG